MSWQTRADTPDRGSLRWYWASISLCTVSSLRQHEITSSKIDWISCPLSLGSSKHLYLHSLWTHKSKQIITSLQARCLEDCHTSVLNSLRTELTRYLLEFIIREPRRRFLYSSEWRLRAVYKTTGKLTILENCASNLILGNYSLILLCLFILTKAFFPLSQWGLSTIHIRDFTWAFIIVPYKIHWFLSSCLMMWYIVYKIMQWTHFELILLSHKWCNKLLNRAIKSSDFRLMLLDSVQEHATFVLRTGFPLKYWKMYFTNVFVCIPSGTNHIIHCSRLEIL